jgi:hypothetical protein
MASVRSYQQYGKKSPKTSETQPFLHYSYILELSCFKMVYISSDRTFQALQNGTIFKLNKRWPVFDHISNMAQNLPKPLNPSHFCTTVIYSNFPLLSFWRLFWHRLKAYYNRLCRSVAWWMLCLVYNLGIQFALGKRTRIVLAGWLVSGNDGGIWAYLGKGSLFTNGCLVRQGNQAGGVTLVPLLDDHYWLK